MSVKMENKFPQRQPTAKINNFKQEKQIQQIVVTANSIKFHKKIVDSLQLQCFCQTDNTLTFKNQSSFIVELDPTRKFNVVKNHVRHIFVFDQHELQHNSYIVILFPPHYFIKIQNYALRNNTHQIKLVQQQYDEQSFTQCYVIRPLELFQERIKERVLKMSKSQKKQLNFSQNKKISFVNESVSSTSFNLLTSFNMVDSLTQGKMKKNKETLILQDRTNISNVSIRGVEYKKSLEKKKQKSERSQKSSKKSRNSVNTCSRIKNLQTISTTKYKAKNDSKIVKKRSQTNISEQGNLDKSQHQKKQLNSDFSNASFYTSKKSLYSVFQGENQNQTALKNSSYQKTKTQGKNINKSKNTKGGFNLSTNMKSFNKNISQSKIMQVSRAFVDRTKK